MSDQELKELLASLAVAQRETDRQLKESDIQRKKDKEAFNKSIKKLNDEFLNAA